MNWIKRVPDGVWLLLAMGVALVVRAPGLGRESLWFDEAISFSTARLSFHQILSNVILDPHPPLYYLTLRVWREMGFAGPEAGRIVGIIFNTMLAPIVWGLGRVWRLSSWQRWTAVSLIIISPFHILYSHELRMYTMLMTWAALLVLAYQLARRRGGWWWAALGITAVLAMYTHLFAAFVLLAVGLHALIERHNRQALWRTVLVGVVVVIAFLPWLMILAGESDIGGGSFRPLGRGGDADIVRNPVKPIITLAFLLFGQSFTLWYSALILFLALATGIILLLELRKAWREDDRSMLLPLLTVVCVVGGPLFVYYVRPFFLPERTMAAASPFLIILLAWGMTRRRSPLPLLVGVTAVVMLIGTTRYLAGDPIKPPYRRVSQFVVEQAQPGDFILHTSDGSYLPALSYIDAPQHALLAGDPDQRKPTAVYEAYGGEVASLETAVAAADRLWVIVALEHSVAWQQDQAARIESQFTRINRWEIDGIIISLYETPSSAIVE